MTQFTAVYVDGVLVDRRQSSGVYVWDAAPAEHTYKVVTDTTLDAARWKLATEGPLGVDVQVGGHTRATGGRSCRCSTSASTWTPTSRATCGADAGCRSGSAPST